MTPAQLTLFDLPATTRSHPAPYSDALLLTFVRMLRGSRRVLDPFAGSGKIFLLRHWLPELQIQAIELEPEWVNLHPGTTVGNALHLPFACHTFDAICTSPTYGNRMSDPATSSAHGNSWTTYPFLLGRKLQAENSGALSWGPAYRTLHTLAWQEARRVLRPGGRFVLNCKDHIRDGARQYVTAWHAATLQELGFTLIEQITVPCPGMRHGRNWALRLPYEEVLLFQG